LNRRKRSQSIFDAKTPADKDALYKQVIENISDSCEPVTTTPLFKHQLRKKMVAKAWTKAVTYVKTNDAPFPSAPVKLLVVLRKIHAHIITQAAAAANKKKQATDKRKRNVIAEQGVGERSPKKRPALDTAVTSLPTPPHSPDDSPPCTPRSPDVTPPTHTCLKNCKYECIYGGPGPANWCRTGNHYSLLFIGPLREHTTPSTSCQRCVCVGSVWNLFYFVSRHVYFKPSELL
jgi:hypothetical protein